MRLSDIFKKTAKQPPPQTTEAAPPKIYSIPQIPQAKPQIQQQKEPVKVYEPSADKSVPAYTSDQVYTEAITTIKNILSSNEITLSSEEYIPCINQMVEVIKSDASGLLILADRATPDNYLYGHSVNVCIFSLFLGHALKIDRLAALGHCALLHDVGMIKSIDVAMKNTRLTAQEHTIIKKHPAIGSDSVQSYMNLNEELRVLTAKVLLQHHERKDGSGYPLGLAGNDIHEFARIISICDVYEALTHPRPYRARVIPHEGIKTIIGATEGHFDPDIVRAFVENISLYPPGSYVRLNTEETARITGINKGLPTRPLIRVILDASGQKAKEPRNIDLSATPMLFIKEPIDETKLQFQDKKLSLEMKAMRWWVKGL